MKKSFFVALIIAAFMVMAGAARADMIDIVRVGDIVKLATTISGFSGGPFTLTNQTTGDSWSSFCLEKDEYFYPNYPYIVDSISDTAIKGGVNTDSGDLLDPKTAFLYYHYRKGDLGNYASYTQNGTTYTFVSSDVNWLMALQNVIWFIEQEIGSLNGDAKANALFAAANNYSQYGWTGLGNVRVVNISGTQDNFRPAQSQLALVPEPSTLMFLGAGLLGLAFAVKRRKSRRG